MSTLFVWKEKMQNLYAKYSIYIDKTIQFILAFSVFTGIGMNIGYMKALTQPIAVMALAIVCTFLPPVFIVITAAALVVAHLFSLSVFIAGVTLGLFVLMLVFYLRFSPGKAMIVLLVPFAFWLKIPFIIPIACGLVGTPICVIPVAMGTITYYMIQYIQESAVMMKGNKDGAIQIATLYLQKLFQNKEMWIAIAAFTICILIVYTIRKLSVDHSWEIAIVLGAAANIVIMVVGDIGFDVHTEYAALIGGSLAAAVIAFIIEFFVFSVDYSRSEHLQFEDDEYYYYVKAIPKIQVTPPSKTVKRINERQETSVLDVESVRAKAAEDTSATKLLKPDIQTSVRTERKTSEDLKIKPEEKKAPVTTISMTKEEELELARSLKEELDIQSLVEEELKK